MGSDAIAQRENVLQESEDTNMLQALARNWWMLLIRGIAAVLFGVAILIAPNIALTALVLLWGAYAVVDGIFAVVTGIQGQPAYANRWLTILEGVVSIIAGVIAFIWPGVTATALLYVIAAWAVITGILEVVAAIQLRKEISDEFWLGLGGVLSVVFGVLLFVYPSAGILSLLWLLAIYLIVFGVTTIFLSFRLRTEIDHPHQAQPV
jgi:uncharacterized membrane protein HdeD (DUF308 family)